MDILFWKTATAIMNCICRMKVQVNFGGSISRCVCLAKHAEKQQQRRFLYHFRFFAIQYLLASVP